RKPARRACRAGKHHKRGRLISFAILRENLLPLRLGTSEDGRDELSHLVRGRSRLGIPRAGAVARSRIRLLLRTASARQNLSATYQHARVDTQPIANKPEHDDGANPKAPAASGNAKACTTGIAPPILNVLAPRQLIQRIFCPPHPMQLPQTLVPHTHRLQFPAERDSWIEGIPAGRNQY